MEFVSKTCIKNFCLNFSIYRCFIGSYFCVLNILCFYYKLCQNFIIICLYFIILPTYICISCIPLLTILLTIRPTAVICRVLFV